MGNNPKLYLVNINAYIKFGEVLSICSEDIERKPNFGINQGTYSGTNVRKMMCNNGVFLFLPLFDFKVNLGWEEQDLWIR